MSDPSEPGSEETERGKRLYELVDRDGLSPDVAERVIREEDLGYDRLEATLRAIYKQAIDQGDAYLFFIEAKGHHDVPPYFLCPSCHYLDLDEFERFPDDEPEVLISCSMCVKRFRVPPW